MDRNAAWDSAVVVWSNRKLWRWVELIGALAAPVGGIIAALEAKITGVTLACVFGACIIIARRRIEAIDADARAKQADQTRRVVGRLLDALHQQYFSRVPEAERFEHRVTLFTCQEANPSTRQGKRLEIYARAGRFHRSQRAFAVDDDRMEGCEGVAGRMWFLNATLTLDSLPPWPNDPADLAGQVRHAAAGFLGWEKAKDLNVKATAFTGAPVRVRGHRWGVLLLDSCTPGQITRAKEYVVKRFANMIGAVIEESLT
jgi:hypothetical protein